MTRARGRGFNLPDSSPPQGTVGQASPDLDAPTHPKGSSGLPLVVMAMVIILWGTGPPLTKLISAPPIVGALYRFGLSAPILVILMSLRRRRVTIALLKQTALPGLAFGINLIFVFAALQEATISVLSVIVALQPALLLFLAGPMFGERPTLRQVGWTLVGIGGAAVVILGAGSEIRTTALGLFLGVLTMLTFTVYFVLTRVARSTTDADPISWMAGVNIWSFLATVPPAIVWMDRSDFAQFGGRDWLWLVLVALLAGTFGHVLMSWVHAYIEAARSSLYLLAMHPVAVGLAWAIHDEPLTALQGVGGAIVLASVAAVIRLPKTAEEKVRKSRRKQIEVDSTRAWVIAGAAAITNGVAFGTVYTFGSFFKGMATSFDTGLGPTSVVFGITMFLFFGTGVLSGFLSDRYGPRPLVIVGGALFCGGLFLTSHVTILWHGYFTYGFGLGFGGGLFTAALFATVAGWFSKHRALAQGVTAAGNGLGTMLLIPLAKYWIATYGWRTAFRLLSILCAVAFTIGAILIRRSPVPPTFNGMARLRKASRTSAFRIMSSSSFLMSMALIPAFAFIQPFAEDNGISDKKAASLVMIVGGASIAGRIFLTRFAAVLGSVRVSQACLIVQPIAYAIWLVGRDNYVLLIIFATVLGIGYGGYVALIGEVTAAIFGVVGLGVVLGGVYLASGFGSLIGPPMAGYLDDGASQTAAIAALLAISTVGSLLILALKPDPVTIEMPDPPVDDIDFHNQPPAVAPARAPATIPANEAAFNP